MRNENSSLVSDNETYVMENQYLKEDIVLHQARTANLEKDNRSLIRDIKSLFNA